MRAWAKRVVRSKLKHTQRGSGQSDLGAGGAGGRAAVRERPPPQLSPELASFTAGKTARRPHAPAPPTPMRGRHRESGARWPHGVPRPLQPADKGPGAPQRATVKAPTSSRRPLCCCHDRDRPLPNASGATGQASARVPAVHPQLELALGDAGTHAAQSVPSRLGREASNGQPAHGVRATVLWGRGRVPAGPLGRGARTPLPLPAAAQMPPLAQQHLARARPGPNT